MKGTVREIWHVFDGQSKEVVIPVYQRNYDWQTGQCERLFDDLEEIIAEDREKHFFGAVVGSPEDSFTWVVIDGQQRLTTSSILLLALVHAARAGEIELVKKSLPDDLESNYLLRNSSSDPQSKVKLKPVKDDAEAYRLLFQNDEKLIESSNVTSNYRYFRDRLRSTSLTADEVWLAIQRLEIMHLDLEKNDDPQRIFETLNSTGLALNEADKIRNFVLMGLKTAHQDRLYEYQWNPMEKNVDYRTDWFIRWYLVTKTSRTPRQDEVYESFKRYVRRSHQSIDEVLKEMREYSEYARQITHYDTGVLKIDSALSRYKALHSDVILPFLMPVLRDFQAGEVPAADMVRIIEILESYQLRRTVCGMWANALNKIFANAYHELRRLRTKDQPYPEILTYLLRRRDDSSGRFPDDEEFRRELETRNIYRLRGENRSYLFACLENLDSKDIRDISGRLATGELSIEHIMPQTLTQTWRNDLGPDAEEIHQTWLNRLGNLTVTGYNSSYSNSAFTSKKNAENGLNDSPYRLNAYVKTQSVWGAEQIEHRTRALADAALGFWKYAETDFAPPAAVLPTEPMGTSRIFRGREIVAYEYGDTTETVGAWSEALPGIVRALLRDHRSRVIASAADNAMLSTDPAHIDTDERGWITVDSALAVYAATSTNHKIRGLRQLFSDLELDPGELIFTLRPEKTEGTSSSDEAEEMPELAQTPYAGVTKFRPRFEELAGTNADLADTEQVRQEFRKAIGEHRVENPLAQLGGRPALEFTPAVIAQASPEQVIALIMMELSQEAGYDPSALHRAILDGRATAWVARLAEV